MSTIIKGMMSRKQIRTLYAVSDKTFNRKLSLYLPGEFKGTKTFTPLEVQRIVNVLGPWHSTNED